ncbi:MAG TPA: hypothetical protein VN228_02470, partial [Pyrinomonadaceae bacterium]|nr:hypothetical protein [Pyrinomonadaceae bacterium]
MLRLASLLIAFLSFAILTADFAEASTQRRRRRARRVTSETTVPQTNARGVVNSSRFGGANPCARIQAAIDSLGGRGGTVVADEAGDCGDSTQVRVRGGVTLRLPPGTFTYSMRGYGGARNMVGALFLLDSDSTLEGSGPQTVVKESSWVHTTQTPAEQRRSIANGEHQATFKVILTYANAVANGSTARNITVRNLKLAGGKPDLPGSWNSAGGALDLANCHNCLVENVHMERTRSIGIHIGGHVTAGQDPGADLVERGVRQPLGR